MGKKCLKSYVYLSLYLSLYLFVALLVSTMFQDLGLRFAFIVTLIIVSLICGFISYETKGGRYEK